MVSRLRATANVATKRRRSAFWGSAPTPARARNSWPLARGINATWGEPTLRSRRRASRPSSLWLLSYRRNRACSHTSPFSHHPLPAPFRSRRRNPSPPLLRHSLWLRFHLTRAAPHARPCTAGFPSLLACTPPITLTPADRRLVCRLFARRPLARPRA
jgi:hypothetical protein